LTPVESEALAAVADLQPELRTNARSDQDLVEVWLKSNGGNSPHTRRAYQRIGSRFIGGLAERGSSLRKATIEDIAGTLDAMQVTDQGNPASEATAATYVAAVKSLLGFAHRVGYT